MITPRHRNIALLVAGCFFMENLDGTIVAAYTVAFVVLAIIALAATAGAFRLHPEVGDAIRRRGTDLHVARRPGRMHTGSSN